MEREEKVEEDARRAKDWIQASRLVPRYAKIGPSGSCCSWYSHYVFPSSGADGGGVGSNSSMSSSRGNSNSTTRRFQRRKLILPSSGAPQIS